MRIPTFRLLLALAAIIALLLTRAAKGDGFPNSAQLGLQLSLTTSGLKFQVGDAAPAPRTKSRAPAVPREAFSAAAILVNLSRTDTTLTYPSTAAATNRFAFQLADDTGAVLWTSDAATAADDAPAAVTLARRSALRRVIQVPLKLNGAWLASGRYSLKSEAGGVSASVFFDVVNTPASIDPIPPNTGIRGQLFQRAVAVGSINWSQASAGSMAVTTGGIQLNLPVPVAGTISVERLVGNANQFPTPIGRISVQTDAQGNFTIPLAPGRYRVQADSPAVAPYPTLVAVYVQADVVAGQYTPLAFVIAGDLREGGGVAAPNITSASGKIVGGAQGTIEITATTYVPTGGYSNPRLVQRTSANGALELDFLIEPPAPGTMVTQAFVTHTATATIPYAAYSYVRIYSVNGSQDMTLEGGGSF